MSIAVTLGIQKVTHPRHESGRPTRRGSRRLGRSRAFPRSGRGSGNGVGPCMSGCTAATRTAFGLLRRGGKLSLSCHASSTGSSRLQAVKGRRCISRPPLAFRNAPAFTSRGGLVSLHRRHAGESPASLNSPRVSRPPFPFSETPPVRPPEFPQTRSRESPPPPSLTAPATPPTSTHSQTSSRAPAETTRSRAPYPPSPPRPRKTRSATRRTRPRSRERAVVTGRW